MIPGFTECPSGNARGRMAYSQWGLLSSLGRSDIGFPLRAAYLRFSHYFVSSFAQWVLRLSLGRSDIGFPLRAAYLRFSHCSSLCSTSFA